MSKAARVIASLLYTALFIILCISGPVHEAAGNETIFGGAQVKLSLGNFGKEEESLTGKIKPDDLTMLGHFSNLKEADFRGSSCYEAISAWAAENPQIKTLFSVPMPDGSSIDCNARKLDLSRYSSADVPALLRSLAYLPDISDVTLGDIGGSGLQMEDIRTLKETLPEAKFDFNFVLQGNSVSPDAESIDLSTVSSGEVEEVAAVLSCMNNLKSMKLNPSLTLDEAITLADCAPEAKVDYSFTLYDRTVNFTDTALDYSYVSISDDGALMSRVLPHMKSLKTLDMDTTGVSYKALEKMREDNPNVDIIWRIWFGENYSVRTDAERILASKPTVGGMITDDTAWLLKYCTKVKYLDVGHNDDLATAEYLSHMPDLEVLIIAMTSITDISGLANCPKLNYLELNSTNIADISVLKNCTQLRDVNIVCCPNITDISMLYDIPMDRFWIGTTTPVPADQIAAMKSSQPGCNVNTTAVDPHDDYWRYTRYDPDEPKYYWVPRYERLRSEMGYDYQEYSFYWLDPKCDKPAPPEHAGKYGRQVYG